MRARLARYASTPPDVFGRLTPARTRELNKDVGVLLNDEWEAFFELAKMIAMAR
jgi:hypothetical protein